MGRRGYESYMAADGAAGLCSVAKVFAGRRREVEREVKSVVRIVVLMVI